MSDQGKRVLVVGAGKAGVACAEFCVGRGMRVTLTDRAPDEALANVRTRLGNKVLFEFGGHRPATFLQTDQIVMSPGVPELAETRAARDAGVEVIGEIELAYRYLRPETPLVAITGTNGKSTTTSLLGAIFQATGRPTFCGGNLGDPLINAVSHAANSKEGFVVAEVAGFQLETCTSFRPKVAVALNISEDHLDRYGSMEVYASMKNRIFAFQNASDFAVFNHDDRLIASAASAAKSQKRSFSLVNSSDPYAAWDEVTDEFRFGDSVVGADFPNLIGRHNKQNILAALVAASVLQVPLKTAEAAVRKFVPLPHRMQFVAEKGGVRYYNDSKATNVASVVAALSGFPRRVVLIAGGVDKGGDYGPLVCSLEKVGQALVTLGEAAPVIEAAVAKSGARLPCRRADDMGKAVAAAADLAQSGDAVLLAPACSSYDMFRNFEERGNAFEALVNALPA